MRLVILSQLRRGGGRLAAAGIAIALGAAFVAVALLGSAIVKTTAYNAVSAGYAKADLVVDTSTEPFSSAQLDTIAGTAGVAAVSPVRNVGFIVAAGQHSDYVWGATSATDPRLEPATVSSGRLPTTATEIAIGAANAERIGASIGDALVAKVERGEVRSEDGTLEMSDGLEVSVELVGILPDPAGFNFDAPRAIVLSELAESLAEAQGTSLDDYRALVLLEPDASLEPVREALVAAPGLDAPTVSTVEEAAHEAVTQFSGETDILTSFVLAFAGIALVVAAIVISNTFQVLVAQRAQFLALLRCVGATRRQVRRSVLVEAGVVGIVASTIGLAFGILLAQIALWIVPSLGLAVPVPTTVVVTPAVVLWPVVTGTLVTMLAALTPARIATRVAPLAALRPVELAPVRKSGPVRLVVSLVGLLVGGGLLAGATVLSLSAETSDPTLFVLVGILGGAISFAAILVGAVYFVPAVARWLGLLASRFGGVPGKIAAANSVRNPRRTTATASALLIGATLVTMMATGAATARGSIASLLDNNFPIDIAVEAPWSSDSTPPTLTANQIAAVRQAEGIANIAEVHSGTVDVDLDGADAYDDVLVYTGDPGELEAVMRSGSEIGVEAGSVGLPEWMEVDEGETVTLTAGETSIDLKATESPIGGMWLTETDFERLGGASAVSSMWLSLDPTVDPRDVATALQDTFTELSATVGDPPADVSGAAVERLGYEQVIDTMLAIIVGLLGVAVLIALVGVANTLSLSVLERRRESATLRAIGLRRAQLRQMLAVEGVIIALVGAVLGAALGLAYGWIGSTLLLGSAGDLVLVMPWRDVGLVLAIGVVAGLVASVLPSRTATRTPPVAALAVD